MKFYFTYGTWEGFPFEGGWTIVEADDREKAISIFRLYHPDYHNNIINCAEIYNEEKFREMECFKNGNCGAYCHEYIYLTRKEV